MKIAIIGGGISGLACAWRLSKNQNTHERHQITLYEANDYIGGHTHTIDVTVDDITAPVDTGFLVFNHRTYPQLVRLFDELGVATAKSDMSFSVKLTGREQGRNQSCNQSRNQSQGKLEWAGHDLNSVFAQRRNLLRPRFLRMLADIIRFNAAATTLAGRGEEASAHISVGSFLERHHFSDAFRDWYLLPMAAAIWSCSTAQMCAFPMATFIRFCHNHGLLQVNHRPQWYTVVGGGRVYVEKMLATLDDVRRSEAALSITRHADGRVTVHSLSGPEDYDQVVLACHSDQALALLADATAPERELLGAIHYQPNHAIVHTDARVLPHNSRAHAAWNYQCSSDGASNGTNDTNGTDGGVCVHYLMNRLQPLPFQRPVMVSLNPFERPAPESVIAEFDYSHPVFDAAAIAAQQRLAELQGKGNIWFCGAWTGYGFHEDGLKSGLAVAAALQQRATSVATSIETFAAASEAALALAA